MNSAAEGWHGWDVYAPFYDWENARTLGRRDVAFWSQVLAEIDGPALELGCGTGRLLAPLARSRACAHPTTRELQNPRTPSGTRLVGIDRSAPMLDRARARLAREARADRPRLVRGDIRALPFAPRSFDLVVAAYGILQSLLNDRDFAAALTSAATVLRRGGHLGIDLVPDLPVWEEYERRVPIRGRLRTGTTLTLIETVRQDRRRRLTMFDEQYVERRGRSVRRHQFTLTFRTLPMARTIDRIERAGFRVDRVLGSYSGDHWHSESGVWVIQARKR